MLCLSGTMKFSFSQNWLTTGNAGLTGANFLGTTDAQALRIRTNNQVSGIIDYSSTSANTSFGFHSLRVNTGNNNVAMGYKTMWANTTGRVNTAAGAYALYNNTIGYSNVGIGIAAVFANKRLPNLVGIGDSALYNNNTGPGQNTAVGSKSMYATTGGYYNTALGFQSMYSNTSGYINTTIGYQALYSNTSGSSNTAIGGDALYTNSFGFNNTAVGNFSLFFNTGGAINTAIGTQAMYLASDGDYNTAVGHQALYSTTGDKNTSVGTFSLYGNTTGTNNTALGYSASANSGGYTNSTAIGFTAQITGSDQVRIGNASVSSIGGYANWTNISDGRVKKNIKQNVPGLAFINKLVPVTYNLDLEAADRIIQAPVVKDESAKQLANSASGEAVRQSREKKEKVLYTGFIAQQVEKAAQELGYDFSGVDAAKNSKDLYGLRYAEFVVPLVKAVQELSGQNDALQTANTSLQAKNDQLDTKINDLQNQINELKQALTGQSAVVKDKPATGAVLFQNQPNPFNSKTIIRYHLPATYTNAHLVITDISGTTLKTITITTKGDGQISLAAGTLAQGSYYYSLVADGNKIDTKQLQVIR